LSKGPPGKSLSRKKVEAITSKITKNPKRTRLMINEIMMIIIAQSR
jgi:hypothetical protein